MKKVLCVADAPGPAEFLAPVARLLKREFDLRLIAFGTAAYVLHDGAQIVKSEDEAKGAYREIKPDILVAAISSLPNGPYVNNTLIELAHADQIPIVCLQDFWGNHLWSHNHKYVPFYKTACVLDDFAARLWREDGFAGEIAITGNPAFDKFRNIDNENTRRRLREKYGVSENTQVVLWAGQGTSHSHDADKISFSLFVESLRMLHDKNIFLVVRPHPRAEDTGYYEELSRGLHVLDTSDAIFAEDILLVADLVASMYSTSLLHACLLRIPAISVLLSGGGRQILKNIHLSDFPPNTTKATIGWYENDPAGLAGIIQKIFEDQNFQEGIRLAQKEFFPEKGRSAENVYAVIRSMIKEG